MGAVLFFTFGISVLLFGIPTLTYFHAKQVGRRPWIWFIIGFFLPGVASLILSFLPDLSANRNEQTIE